MQQIVAALGWLTGFVTWTERVAVVAYAVAGRAIFGPMAIMALRDHWRRR